jgi:peptidoglycan hydrolase-like amidase
MCQIGAAVMAVKGYGYKQIIAHYFKNTKLEKRIL